MNTDLVITKRFNGVEFVTLTSLGMGGQTSPPIFKIALKNHFASIPSY